LLRITYEALHNVLSSEVWVKSHPFLSIDDVLNAAGISKKGLQFEIKEESINKLLVQARIVIAGETGVSFEALAHGCNLITIDASEQINMSPLRGVKSDIIDHVSSQEALRGRVESIIRSDYDILSHTKSAATILKEQFYLNQHSERPDSFMNVLESSLEVKP